MISVRVVMHHHSIALWTLLPILCPVGIQLCHYSDRMAAMGSIWAARKAGTSDAALAMKVNATTDPSSTHGSRGDVPYRKLANARDAKRAAPRPTAVPES